MDTVLVADGDLGLVFWLGQRLSTLGHQVLPAMSLSHATMLAEEFDFNVVVIDPSLPGAAAFLASLRRSHGPLRVLALPKSHQARLEKLEDLEKALREAPLQVALRPALAGEGLADQPEFVANGLAPSRAALTGVVVGAVLWAAFIVLVTPR